MTDNRHTVKFYTKEGCHLCEAALNTIEQASEKVDFLFSFIDIAQDDTLMMKFDRHIPVIEIDGKIAFKHKVDEKKLISILKS